MSQASISRPRRRRVLAAVAAWAGTAAWPGAALAAKTHRKGGAKAAARSGPPVARVEPVTESFFGTTVVDPYRWMENPKDAEWQPFMRGQDGHARRVLKAIPGREVLKKRIAQLSGGTSVVYGVASAGGKVFYQVRPPGADNFKLAVRQGLDGAERILIDPTTMKGEGGVHLSLDWWLPSPDGRHVVYGLSPAGSENSVAHVMEVDTMRVLPERIAGTQYASPSWLADGSGFSYGRVADLSKAGTTSYYLNGPRLLHRLGTDPAQDQLQMVSGHDPAVPVAENEFPVVVLPRTGEHAVLVVQGGVRRENPLYVARVADLLAGKAQWQRVCELADEVTDFALDANDLYLLTTKGAPNGRVLRTPLAQASYASATEVVAEGRLVIESMTLARDGLYLKDLDGGYHTVRKLDRQGRLAAVPLPWEGSIESLAGHVGEDGVWLDGTGWLLPFTVFRHDPASGRTERVGLTPPSTLDLGAYEAQRVMVKVRDGTEVPLSIVAKKGLPRNGRNPALVQAYGSYQISINPYFSPRTLAFLERGGVFAVAHVRGGGEYGKRWWKGGQKLTKPNTWRDLIDCCEHLVKSRWASSSTITIQGGSAGGITVGMALTERPDLFAGVISNVGVSNALRAEFSQNGPPNIDEFGTVKEADGFKGLLAMDALHHVRDGTRYPAVLLTVGMTDPRVEAWEGAKMAARLQKANRSANPILLRVSFDAGHGLGSTRSQIDDERADEFAFALWRAGRRSVA
ncbi:MAG: prolyl oligopeptidase family serine peptidase [Rubrivivax sp.]